MNGIEKITDKIQADVQAEIDAINREARAQCDEIAARYAAEASRVSQDMLARGRKSAEEREERLASVAQLEGRKLVLAAKQEMLARAFEQALQDLLSLPEKDYIDLLASLALRAATTGREQAILSQKDRTRFGKQAVTQANETLAKTGTGMLTLSEQTRPIQGGLILSDGDVEVNCSFETLVRLQRGGMDLAVAKVLFD